MPAPAVHANDPMSRPVSLPAMPAARRPPAATRSARLPKIMCRFLPGVSRVLDARVLDAVLLRVEDPLVALDNDGVAAVPGLAWHCRIPRHGVAEAGVEGSEVLGGVDDGVAGEVVLDPGRLGEAVEEITAVVVVDGDEAGD